MQWSPWNGWGFMTQFHLISSWRPSMEALPFIIGMPWMLFIWILQCRGQLTLPSHYTTSSNELALLLPDWIDDLQFIKKWSCTNHLLLMWLHVHTRQWDTVRTGYQFAHNMFAHHFPALFWFWNLYPHYAFYATREHQHYINCIYNTIGDKE